MTSIFRTLVDMEETGKACVLCTIITTKGSTPRHEGSKMIVFADGSITGTVGGGEVENRVREEALQALKDGKSRLLTYNMVNPKEGDPGVCGGTLEVFVEPYLPTPTLIVVGGGHVGKVLAKLGKFLNFRVAVSDDRPEFCTKESYPEADILLPYEMSELPAHLEIDPYTYLVLTTRGSNVDVVGLPALLNTPAAYIGIIGSKRRWITTRKELLAQGRATEEELNRVHSPIGLELKAETPEEIAVSIMAEIIMLRNGGTGEIMKM